MARPPVWPIDPFPMTSTRNSLAVHIAPVFLRLVLGGVFVWAGWNKLSMTMPVKGADAALLANLGVIKKAEPPAPAPTSAPAKPLPSSRGPGEVGGGLTLAQAGAGSGGAAPAPVTAGPKVMTAEDFSDPVEVKSVWMLAVMIDHACHPAPGPDGRPGMALWPRLIGEGLWPWAWAVLVVVAEFGGGLGVLLGLLTRFCALSLAGVMAGALWLTEIGPAVASGTARYGFLPAHGPFEWTTFMFQATLLGAALALACAGPGVMSADRAIGALRRGAGGGGARGGARRAEPAAEAPAPAARGAKRG